MRTLFAAAFLAATFSAAPAGLATAQTQRPAPAAAADQQDAARKAWFAHAIDHLLGGTGERAERGDAHPSALN